MEDQLTFEFEKRKPIKGFPELHWTGKRQFTGNESLTKRFSGENRFNLY